MIGLLFGWKIIFSVCKDLIYLPISSRNTRLMRFELWLEPWACWPFARHLWRHWASWIWHFTTLWGSNHIIIVSFAFAIFVFFLWETRYFILRFHPRLWGISTHLQIRFWFFYFLPETTFPWKITLSAQPWAFLLHLASHTRFLTVSAEGLFAVRYLYHLLIVDEVWKLALWSSSNWIIILFLSLLLFLKVWTFSILAETDPTWTMTFYSIPDRFLCRGGLRVYQVLGAWIIVIVATILNGRIFKVTLFAWL